MHPKCLKDLQMGERVCGNMFLVDSGRPTRPPWLDEDKFKNGQRFFRRFAFSVLAAYFFSLLIGFAVRSLARALMMSAKSDNAEKSRKRYLDTIAHIFTWHSEDIFDPETRANRSLRLVRAYHDFSRRQLTAAPGDVLPLNEDRNPNEYLFVNQYDTALVQAGFVGALVSYPRLFGLGADEKSLDDYRYFWRVVGYVLGLEDVFNVCGGSLADLRRITKEIERDLIFPQLNRRESFYVKLADDFVRGLAPFSNVGDENVLDAFIYPTLGLAPPHLGIWQRLSLFFIKCHFWFYRQCYLYRLLWNRIMLSELSVLTSHVFNRLDFQES